jgi:hypothetical protein
MPGLDPGIWRKRHEIAGSSPAMTVNLPNIENRLTYSGRRRTLAANKEDHATGMACRDGPQDPTA